MKLGVIIPVINDNFLPQLLKCITGNTVLPDKIIIIDNTKNLSIVAPTHVKAELHRPTIPLGVNASWNYGIQRLLNIVDLISILNDDLLIERMFFEKLTRLALRNGGTGVFCPETLGRPDFMADPMPIGSELCVGMRRREGWAWTIRSSVAKKIPPIPDKLKTWCGDDWYWRHCNAINRPWMKMINNWCYHYVGQSVRLTDTRPDLNDEKILLKTYF